MEIGNEIGQKIRVRFVCNYCLKQFIFCWFRIRSF